MDGVLHKFELKIDKSLEEVNKALGEISGVLEGSKESLEEMAFSSKEL